MENSCVSFEPLLDLFSFIYFISFLYHLSSNHKFGYVQYNYDGSRLLFSSEKCEAVYDLGTNKKLDGPDKISLSQSSTISSRLAGKEDELVVSSRDRTLFVWKLPTGGQGQRNAESPLLQLDGHQSDVLEYSFNKNIGVLTSSDEYGVIKLWVPNEGSQ